RIYYSVIRPPLRTTLFPYTTLFRSIDGAAEERFDLLIDPEILKQGRPSFVQLDDLLLGWRDIAYIRDNFRIGYRIIHVNILEIRIQNITQYAGGPVNLPEDLLGRFRDFQPLCKGLPFFNQFLEVVMQFSH